MIIIHFPLADSDTTFFPMVLFYKGLWYNNSMKKIGLLGATGSIGTQTLTILREFQHLRLSFLSVHKQTDRLFELVAEFRPDFVIVTDPDAYSQVGRLDVPVYGPDDYISAIEQSDADILINAIVGTSGLLPTVKWIEWGRTLALANKESLVSAGELVKNLRQQSGAQIVPIDSEHSAIWQSLQGNDPKSVHKIILTASGGAFRDHTKQEITGLPAKAALKHPNWSMGQKITIDSATLVNKGLEVMEAKWLFDLREDQIEVLIHRESIIHSMVEYVDGAIMAQLGVPDMKLPILYALEHPKRLATSWPKLDWSQIPALHFEKPDTERFPGLALAFEAMRKGGTMPLVFNVANEVYVEEYLKDKITFYGITDRIAQAMADHEVMQQPSVADLLALEAQLRQQLKETS